MDEYAWDTSFSGLTCYLNGLTILMNMTATKQDEAQPGPSLRVRLKQARKTVCGGAWVSGALDEVDDAAPPEPATFLIAAIGRRLWHCETYPCACSLVTRVRK